MTTVETDEVHEALGGTVRTAATVAAQIAERAAYSVQRQAAERARESEQQARALQERVEVSRTAARASYADTGRPEWWDTAQPARIADAYDAAHAWSGIDPQAKTARETIEREVHTRYGIDADTLARTAGTVGTATRATAAAGVAAAEPSTGETVAARRQKRGDVIGAAAVLGATEAAAAAEGATLGWQAAATEERRLAHTLAATEQTPQAHAAAAAADQGAGSAASAVRTAATGRQEATQDAVRASSQRPASGPRRPPLGAAAVQQAQVGENGAERAVAVERPGSGDRIERVVDAMREAGRDESAVHARRVAGYGQGEPAAAALITSTRAAASASRRLAPDELRRSLAR